MVEQEVGLHKRQANRVFRPAKSAVSLVVQSRLGVHPLAARRRYDRMRVVFDRIGTVGRACSSIASPCCDGWGRAPRSLITRRSPAISPTALNHECGKLRLIRCATAQNTPWDDSRTGKGPPGGAACQAGSPPHPSRRRRFGAAASSRRTPIPCHCTRLLGGSLGNFRV